MLRTALIPIAIVLALGLGIGSTPVSGQAAPWLARDSNGNLYVIANRLKYWIEPREIDDLDLALIPAGDDLLDGFLPAGTIAEPVGPPVAEPAGPPVAEATATPASPPPPPPPPVDIQTYILLGSVSSKTVFIGAEQRLCVTLRAPGAPPVPNVPVTFFAGEYQFHSRTGSDGRACITVYMNRPGAYSFNAVARYAGREIALEGYSDTAFAVLS